MRFSTEPIDRVDTTKQCVLDNATGRVLLTNLPTHMATRIADALQAAYDLGVRDTGRAIMATYKDGPDVWGTAQD